MSEHFHPPKRSWPVKFRDAFRGVWLGIRGQHSFYAHFTLAAAVIAAGAVLRVGLVEWCLLILCIAVVLAAEMFNSALETLARAIDVRHNLHLADGLDIGSGAVLIAALGAAVVGGLVLGQRLGQVLGWW